MKYLLLLIILLFSGCLPKYEYKPYQSCLNEQDALNTAKHYIVNKTDLNLRDIEEKYKCSVIDSRFVYYVSILYDYQSVQEGNYSIRCPGYVGYGLIIRKTNSDIVAFWKE